MFDDLLDCDFQHTWAFCPHTVCCQLKYWQSAKKSKSTKIWIIQWPKHVVVLVTNTEMYNEKQPQPYSHSTLDQEHFQEKMPTYLAQKDSHSNQTQVHLEKLVHIILDNMLPEFSNNKNLMNSSKHINIYVLSTNIQFIVLTSSAIVIIFGWTACSMSFAKVRYSSASLSTYWLQYLNIKIVQQIS